VTCLLLTAGAPDGAPVFLFNAEEKIEMGFWIRIIMGAVIAMFTLYMMWEN